jgi:hypothetical protein
VRGGDLPRSEKEKGDLAAVAEAAAKPQSPQTDPPSPGDEGYLDEASASGGCKAPMWFVGG